MVGVALPQFIVYDSNSDLNFSTFTNNKNVRSE